MRLAGFPYDNLSAMSSREKLDQIPRGNTAPGVNRAIIEYLLEAKSKYAAALVLDVPCGNGDFLDSLKAFFPNASTFGADVNPAADSDHTILKVDVSTGDWLNVDTKFDLITCISGVMEFDNTLSFFKQLRQCITGDGVLIVTNDNLLSIRDRVLYLFGGRFRQYPMFVADDAPTWKILPLQNLLRILNDAGFDAGEVRYVPAKWTEWLWLPAAFPIYLIQCLVFFLGKRQMTYKEMAARYPFASLLSRHYFVVLRPKKD